MTLQQILTLQAVVHQGGFQAGAKWLNKTHPSVITTIRKLEQEIGFALFDRKAYRATLTNQGRLFFEKSKQVLAAFNGLSEYAKQLAGHQETEINVVIGDITPVDSALHLLQKFFDNFPNTQLNLHFETLGGPVEKILNGDVDLIFHHIDKTDPRFDYQDFCEIKLLPVVAPDVLHFENSDQVSYQQLGDFPQCIIRDSAQKMVKKDHYIIEGARSVTVADQHTKKAVIMQGMAWGYMPGFLVENEIQNNQLQSIEGKYLKSQTIEIKAVRLSNTHSGPVATRLWEYFGAL